MLTRIVAPVQLLFLIPFVILYFAPRLQNMVDDSENLHDGRKELEIANKTIVEPSKNLKMKEAKLARMKSESVIQSLEQDAVKRSEAEE